MKYTILTAITIFGVLISSIVPCFNQPVWYAQYLGLLFFLCLGISVVIWDFDKILSAFSLFALLSAFFITSLAPRAIVLLFQINLSLLACYGISKFNAKQRKIVCWAILGVVILQYVWITLQYFNIDPIFKSLIRQGHSEVVGFNGAKDQLGSFFAITFPIVLGTCPVLIPLSLIGLFLAKSSFAFISAIISGLIYLYYTNKKYFKVFIMLIIISSVLFFKYADNPKFADFETRGNVWKHSVKATIEGKINIENNNQKLELKTKPIYGYGLGNFLRIFPFVPQQDGFNYVNEKFEHAHNDFVEFFFEFGWIGLALLTVFAFSFVSSFLASGKTQEIVLYFSSLIAYFLNANGNFLSHLGFSGMMLIVLYSLYRGSLNVKR